MDPQDLRIDPARAAWPRAGGISSTTAADRRTRCAPTSRPRIGFDRFPWGAISARDGSGELRELEGGDLRAFLADGGAKGSGRRRPRASCPEFAPSCNLLASRRGRRAAAADPRPRRPRTLPRPASPDDAKGLAEDAAGAASLPWIGARDLAMLLLLYGAGLRVAEALSLTRARPIGATLRVTGKRSKTRIVPIVPAVSEAIDDMFDNALFAERRLALLRGCEGGAAQSGSGAAFGGGGEAAVGLPDTPDFARPAP